MRAYRSCFLALIAVACCGLFAPGQFLTLLAQPADDGAQPPAAGTVPPPPRPEEPPPADDAFGADQPAMSDEREEAEVEARPNKPAPRSRAQAEQAETEPQPVAPQDPAVLAVLESNPQTPAELLRAISILKGLGHAPLAKKFADQLGQTKLDQKAKAELVARFDAADLLKLATDDQLSLVLGPFIDDLLKSAEAYRRDPKRLDEWAAKLTAPNATVRARAAVALLDAGESAVAPLVTILADPAKTAGRTAAKAVLVHLGGAAVPPLLGVLESPDANLRAEVIDVLGQIGSSQAVPQLLAPLVSPSSPTRLKSASAQALRSILGRALAPREALAMLERSARQLLDQSRHASDDVLAPTEVWHWNAKRRQSMPIQYGPTGAAVASSVRLARDLYLLDPTQADHRRLYLTALLSAAKFRAGLGKPLPSGTGTAYSIAASEGAEAMDGLLAYALDQGYLPAATAAAQILGDIGSTALLTRSAAPSPLVRAVEHRDRRVSFAALEAIMKLKPTEPFAGSNKVVSALSFFAGSFGVPRALVVHPRSDQGRRIAGLAATMGYEGDIAINGRQAFELATGSPDYELIFIHSAIDRPKLDELVAQLRRDPRTAALPLGLIAPYDDLDRVRRFAQRVPATEAILQPQTEDEMKLLTQRVVARADRSIVPHDERFAEAVAALDWLAALERQPSRVFGLEGARAAVLRALNMPQLSSRAAAVLARVGSPRAQRALVELADSATQPLETRTAAAAALATSVRLFGIALSSQEILQQYDLYNANAGRDADTHQVLTAVLDAIEQRAAGG